MSLTLCRVRFIIPVNDESQFEIDPFALSENMWKFNTPFGVWFSCHLGVVCIVVNGNKPFCIV